MRDLRFNCVPVMMDSEIRERHYKGFCKEYLWNMMHYVLPMGQNEQGLKSRCGKRRQRE